MTHFMVDLETMGEAIVAIGAVAFDKETVFDRFYKVVDLRDSAKYMDMEPATILWWLKQSEEARTALTDKSGVKLMLALFDLAEFMNRHEKDECERIIWAYGANYDFPRLEKAYEVALNSFGKPFKYWNLLCARTAIRLAGVDMKAERADGAGVYHRADDDAAFQAQVMIKYGILWGWEK